MDTSLHPEWAGIIELASGAQHYTCSVRCTLATALHSEKFLGVAPDQIRKVRVPDYLHPGTLLDAPKALFVVDSDVRGPMGAELIPAANEADAQTITTRHGGRTLHHADVTPPLLMAIKQHGKSTP
ncbi:MAG: nitrous oxide reductase accessory protein NosL [Deltaproteobacteria bacterium]|nr:nitrous oxide reductase accessory protein NosL [Deltaproteobacteria bacterium]